MIDEARAALVTAVGDWLRELAVLNPAEQLREADRVEEYLGAIHSTITDMLAGRYRGTVTIRVGNRL